MHDEPEQPGQSPLVGHRRAHHHRHGPSPYRDDRADAKSEADFAVGDDEIVRIANERGLDRERQRQQKNAEPDHDREAEPRAQPVGERQYRLIHLRNPHARAKRQLSGRCRHCARQRVNAANKNKRLSIERFAFERMNWSRSFVLRQNSFFAAAPNAAAHSLVEKQFHDGKPWKVFSLNVAECVMKFQRVNFYSISTTIVKELIRRDTRP